MSPIVKGHFKIRSWETYPPHEFQGPQGTAIQAPIPGGLHVRAAGRASPICMESEAELHQACLSGNLFCIASGYVEMEAVGVVDEPFLSFEESGEVGAEARGDARGFGGFVVVNVESLGDD